MTSLASVEPALRVPSRDERYQILKWFACYVVFSLLPLWGGYGLSSLLGHDTSIGDYVGRGEFFLYTASLTGATLFLVTRDSLRGFPFRSAITLANVVILSIAVLFFGGVFTSIRQPTLATTQAVSIHTLAWTSILVYVVSLAFAIFAQYVDIIASSYNPRTLQEEDASTLARQVRELED